MLDFVTDKRHTQWQGVVFQSKVLGLQAQRWVRNVCLSPVQRFKQVTVLPSYPMLAEIRSDLWSGTPSPQEQWLERGKVHNLRVACQRLNGLQLPAGKPFSFWAHVGAPTRWHGFVEGRELREGCLIPSVGGGLCQLSNGLYAAALKAGFTILERHAHTEVIPGSQAELGQDATVFWNYVDLRFQAPGSVTLKAYLTDQQLVVAFYGALESNSEAEKKVTVPVVLTDTNVDPHGPNSCASCGVTSCFRHIGDTPVQTGMEAVVVDEVWPEFDAYVQAQLHPSDPSALLLSPADGRAINRLVYAWTTEGFKQQHHNLPLVMARSWRSRRLARQGAARQRALLEMDRQLAQWACRQLTSEVTHVTVAQTLLPWLWDEGALWGRTFDVLMTRWPLSFLEGLLDGAAALHPESPTLADFRADSWLKTMETEALAHARRVVTPHRAIATCFPQKTTVLDWARPDVQVISTKGSKIGFLGPSLGRKGAYEMRQVALELGLANLVVLGPVLEAPDFWAQVPHEHRPFGPGWMSDLAVVVAPAWIEHKPRLLLEALSAGIPVIATSMVGLPEQPGLTIVQAGSPEALLQLLVPFTEEGLFS